MFLYILYILPFVKYQNLLSVFGKQRQTVHRSEVKIRIRDKKFDNQTKDKYYIRPKE